MASIPLASGSLRFTFFRMITFPWFSESTSMMSAVPRLIDSALSFLTGLMLSFFT